mgnify:CR=1 FL=1
MVRLRPSDLDVDRFSIDKRIPADQIVDDLLELIIIGHGTERNSNSAEIIYQVTSNARAEGLFGRVETGFLDQEPDVGEVLAGMAEHDVVLVPFFIAEGWHTQETIPDDLGINRPSIASVTEVAGRLVHYAPPVGTFPEVAEIVLQRAREAGAEVPASVGGTTEAAGV